MSLQHGSCGSTLLSPEELSLRANPRKARQAQRRNEMINQA
jgi:hypothetical protein